MSDEVTRLSASELDVLLTIAQRWLNDDGTSTYEIILACRYAASTVQRCIQALSGVGFIERDKSVDDRPWAPTSAGITAIKQSRETVNV